ncbi:MAG: patatin-like phospholipase family protein [Lautropia sp.]|nr:patatin-like phospholipase family protein [Lautropia sp.]
MFDKVIFAGGGHRCWWQAGFWEVLRAEIELRPRVIGAVSTGAFMACLVHANDSRRALAWYERELAGVRTNLAWTNLFKRGEPLFRQGGIYRKALRALLGAEHYRELMWQAPEIRVLYALPPAGTTDRQLAWHGWRVYRRDASLTPQPMHRGGEEGGGAVFREGVKRLQDCRTERDMVELLYASSCLPPMMAPSELDGELVLNGEMIDPVPVRLVSDVPGPTLVLTTRRYTKKTPVFAANGCLYVQPSSPVAASGWDFTAPKRFLKTYEQGRQDAEAFLKLFGLGAFRQEAHFGGALLAGAAWPGEAAASTRLASGAAPLAPLSAEAGGVATGLPTGTEIGDTVPVVDDVLDLSAGEGRPATFSVSGTLVTDMATEVGVDQAHPDKPVASAEAAGRVAAPEPVAMPGDEARVAGDALPATVRPADDEDFQHTLGELSDKLFEKGRRSASLRSSG